MYRQFEVVIIWLLCGLGGGAPQMWAESNNGSAQIYVRGSVAAAVRDSGEASELSTDTGFTVL